MIDDILDLERYEIDDVERLLLVTPADVEAADARSFARNMFVPLTTACTYCTYFDPPGKAR